MNGLPPGRLLVGSTPSGWFLTRPEHALLVLGPPRSGKTTGVMIPNVVAASGPVVATSTKPDVMYATLEARRRAGRCWLFDPTGRTDPPEGVEPLRWSPVASSAEWDGAVMAAQALVSVSRPRPEGDAGFWWERAEALLAPLLHAAALGTAEMPEVVSWVDRRDASTALEILEMAGTVRPLQVLAGLLDAYPREMSAVWSTASSALSGYRLGAALDASRPVNFDAAEFVRSNDTVYICAPGRHQAACAPLVVGLLDHIRDARYALHPETGHTEIGHTEIGHTGTGRANNGRARLPHLVLALDEVANIAPLPGLASLVSEGGSQGVLTIACLQDLSQARVRWGEAADGFLTLFGTKLVLPGVSDVRTLEALSALAGQQDVPVRSTTRRTLLRTDTTWSTRREPRLPPDVLRAGHPGHALALEADQPPVWVRRLAPAPERSPAPERERTPALEEVSSPLPTTGPRDRERPGQGRTPPAGPMGRGL